MNKFNFDRITLVEDDPVVTILMVKIIRSIGFDGPIHQFGDGEKALVQFKKLNYEFPSEDIHLILLDINMPILDGWEVLNGINQLSEDWKENQFITMITSSIDQHDKKKAFSFSMVKDFIQKPISIQLLKEFLKKHNLFEE